MDSIVNSAVSTWKWLIQILSPIVDINMLLIALLFVLIAWLASPGRAIKKFNVPILEWAAIVVAIFIGLNSLTILKKFGLSTSDIIIVALGTIIVGLIVMMRHNHTGKIARIVMGGLVLLSLSAVIVAGTTGPSTSFLAQAVRTGQSAVNQILGSYNHT